MAETIKSVLLVDFDSIHRSLSADDETAAQRLALRLHAWISAIEAGGLFVETPDEPQHRRILIRRCYADPSLLGDDRKIFLTNGFQVVDCPPAEGRTHNAAAIHMVLDAIDAIEHPTGYEDFILLSADSDLSPLLIRLRAHNRTATIYTNAVTAESYKSIADAMIEESRFAEVLLSDDEPESEEEEEAPPPAAERSEVEALARKIASATNVPLFAPRTFADLFRHLAAEVSENGYHFQKTAESVATRMADAGRNVTRRQVVFVVKGLALKGHVFSSDDTADQLAEVFREQVLYLAENAGVPLDEDDRRVLSDWIVGSTSTASLAEKTVTAKADAAPKSDAKAASAKPTGTRQPSRAARGRQQKSNAAVKPREEAKAATPATEPVKSAEPSKPSTKPSEADKPSTATGKDQTKSAAAESKPAAGSARQSSASATPTAAAERSSKDDKPKSDAPAAASGNRTSGTAATAKQSTPSRDADKDAEAESDTVESSILAAIAEAVDVLVEDGGEADDRDTPDQSPAPANKKAKASAESEEEEEAEGDDIGDEIQRIIASYNRNRKTGGD